MDDMREMARKLAEALRDLLSTDQSMSDFREVCDQAEALVAEAERTGLIEPQD